MVDVSEKSPTVRHAVARATLKMAPSTRTLVLRGTSKKGDVLAAARIAGIQGAKKTAELIPLCHPIAISGIEIEIESGKAKGDLVIEATVRTTDRTGVEMEALTAVSVAALTVYDMVKAVDRGMTIESIALIEKRGGKSDYRR